MTCYCCNGEAAKFGFFHNRNRTVQRYRCRRCGKTFAEKQPLDGVRIELAKSVQVVHLMAEGMGIRAISRLTQLNKRTVLGILEVAGQRCAELLDAHIQNVKAENVQVDEIHTFVGCKRKRNTFEDLERGDFFTYLSVDRESKLIINWRTSKRNRENTLAFMQDLKTRIPERFQLTTDAFIPYWRGKGVVGQVFGQNIDYATELKIFGRSNNQISRFFNPLTVIGIKRQRRIGTSDLTTSTTCHAERTNLSVRTFTRRFTRCTLGYSKKVANLQYAVAIFIAHFNFCRVHSAHKQTPAMAAGLADHAWSVEEMLTRPV